MPSQKDLLKFKDILNQLGNEPRILEERGEEIEDIPFEEGRLDSDVNDLISGESGSDDLSGIFSSLSETQDEGQTLETTEINSEDSIETNDGSEIEDPMSLPGDQMDFSDFEFEETEQEAPFEQGDDAENESSLEFEVDEDTPDFGNILPEDFSIDMDTISDKADVEVGESEAENNDFPMDFGTDDLDFSMGDEEGAEETPFNEADDSQFVSASDEANIADQLNLSENDLGFSLDTPEDENSEAPIADKTGMSEDMDLDGSGFDPSLLADDFETSESGEDQPFGNDFGLDSDSLSGLGEDDDFGDSGAESDDDFTVPEDNGEFSSEESIDKLLNQGPDDFQAPEMDIADKETIDDFNITDDFPLDSSSSDFDSDIGGDEFRVPEEAGAEENDFSSDFGDDASFGLPSELFSELESGDLGDSGFGADLDDSDGFSLPGDFDDDDSMASEGFNFGEADDFSVPEEKGLAESDEKLGSADDFSFGPEEESSGADDADLGGDDLLTDSDFSIPDEFSIDNASFDDEMSSPEEDDFAAEIAEKELSSGGRDSSIEIEADDEDLSGFGSESEIDDIGEFSLPDEFADSSDSEIDFSVPEGDEGLGSMGNFEDSSGEDEIDEFSLPDEFSMPDSFGNESLSGASKTGSFDKSEDEFLLDEFSLPEMGSMPDKSLSSTDDQFQQGGIPEANEADLPGEDQIEISDIDFGRIQQTLITLPRQLKILVQDLIGQNRVWGVDLHKLLDLLKKGASPQAIADLVSALTGEKIVLPKGFEKKTGLDFEREKRSFAYIFKENIVPMLRVLLPVAFLVFLLILGVINLLVYLNAQNHYQRGIVLITEEKQPDMGNEEFRIAQESYYEKNWYYRYAEAFIQEKNYQYARDKYEELLGILWEENKILYISNPDKKALLDYADFESRDLRNFPKAEILYKALLNEETFHEQGLLGHGDNYMEWAKENPSKYEDARNAYAEYRSRYGDTDEVYFRFLRYFIRTDQFQIVRDIKDAVQANEKRVVNPEIYTELGKYLIDKGALNDVRAVLDRSLKVDFNLPQSHYQLARYFKIMEDSESEETALKNTRNLLENQGILPLENLKMYIDSLSRLGDLYYNQGKELDSLRELNNAIKIIEDRQEKRIIDKEPAFGKVYYTLGNIFYDNKDFEEARKKYLQAGENKFMSPEMDYKEGYIAYWNEDYEAATLKFHDTEDELRDNRNTMFSLANSLYFQGHYNAAQGYYNHILNLLEKERERIPLIRPDEFPDHASLLSFMYAIYNNLGVTLYRLSQESPNPRRESQALVYLTKAMETSDILDRLIYSPELMERSPVGAKDNPGLKRENREYQNQRAILHESKNYELQVYKKLPINAYALELPETASEYRVQ
ncbi:MAG: hypothetical protein JXR70_12455 [Spirochaetales bacterium]|nr:hypothetical protein [Spirochaetales bacterium]